MTAVNLFDLLARGSPEDGSRRLITFGEKLVACCLADLDRPREYEQHLELPVADPVVDLELRRSVWQLYSEWAAEAQQVFTRARSLEPRGIRRETVQCLGDAIGRVLARLSLRPEQVAKAREQVRQGQTVLAKELRDELHARLRT